MLPARYSIAFRSISSFRLLLLDVLWSVIRNIVKNWQVFGDSGKVVFATPCFVNVFFIIIAKIQDSSDMVATYKTWKNL